MSKFVITREEAQTKFNEYHNALWPHDEVYTDGSKRVGAAAVTNHHFQNGQTTCRHLSKRQQNNSTIFAAEAMAITLALDYYLYMDPVKHNVVVYSVSMSCLQAIEGEYTLSVHMITREEAWAKFNEYHNALWPHDEVYTDGSKRVGAAAVINRHFQNSQTTCRHLSKRQQNNSTIFIAEATAITLALDMDPVKHDVVVLTQCLACRRLRAKILKTLSPAISWAPSGHWATKAPGSTSAGCQGIVALRVMRQWTS